MAQILFPQTIEVFKKVSKKAVGQPIRFRGGDSRFYNKTTFFVGSKQIKHIADAYEAEGRVQVNPRVAHSVIDESGSVYTFSLKKHFVPVNGVPAFRFRVEVTNPL
jgi:hypothetical protein